MLIIPKSTQQKSYVELLEVALGDSSYEDRESCNESGYCYDSANDFSNTELEDYDTPESCIQAAPALLSVAYDSAATYLRAEAQGGSP